MWKKNCNVFLNAFKEQQDTDIHRVIMQVLIHINI